MCFTLRLHMSAAPPRVGNLKRANRGASSAVMSVSCSTAPAGPAARTTTGLNDLLGAKEARENETLAHLPKAGAGKPVRAPVKFPPDVTEATVSMAEKLTTPITVSEAGQRNSCEV